MWFTMLVTAFWNTDTMKTWLEMKFGWKGGFLKRLGGGAPVSEFSEFDEELPTNIASRPPTDALLSSPHLMLNPRSVKCVGYFASSSFPELTAHVRVTM